MKTQNTNLSGDVTLGDLINKLPPPSILVDTNVIIEAHSTKCWKALVGHHSLDTVEMCIQECDTGNRGSNVRIDTVELGRSLNPKKVGASEIAAL